MDEAKSSIVHLHKRHTRSAPTANRECASAVGADRAAGRSARTDQGDACAIQAAGSTAATSTGHRSASPPADAQPSDAPPSASAPGSPASCTSYTSCAASPISPARAAAGATAAAATAAAAAAASAAAAAAIAAADMAVPSPNKGKRKAGSPSARPPFGSPDVLAQLLALERGACDGGTPATPRIEREARRGSPPSDELDWAQPAPQQGAAARQLASEVRGAQEAAAAAPAAPAAPPPPPPDGAERRAVYWRPCAIAGRDAAARSAPNLAPRNAARAGRAPDVELEQCTFAPRLNAHSLRIEAMRHAATGAPRSAAEMPASPAHPHPHRLRTSLHTDSAPPSWLSSAHLLSPPPAGRQRIEELHRAASRAGLRTLTLTLTLKP